jgi:opacity protein-like surface antigen
MNHVLQATTILLFTSSIALAGTMGNEYPDIIHDGFYVAGAIGTAGLVDKESHDSSPETHQLGALGIIGGGYLGYDYGIGNSWILALEFFADATGLNSAITHEPFTYHQNQSYDLGVRVLPKYAFTPTTTGHVILGYTNGRFAISDNGVYGYINTNYNKSGFQTGLGFTTALNDSFSFRLDAIYDIYASQTDTGLGLTAGTLQLYTNRFSTLAGELSLIYKFS